MTHEEITERLVAEFSHPDGPLSDTRGGYYAERSLAWVFDDTGQSIDVGHLAFIIQDMMSP